VHNAQGGRKVGGGIFKQRQNLNSIHYPNAFSFPENLQTKYEFNSDLKNPTLRWTIKNLK
jgi:hypothetical protein